MVAVGHEGDIAVVDLAAQVDRAAGAAVGAVQAKSLGALGAVFDLKVVDLFELALVLGVLLVLVGRVGGPVTAGGDDLAGQQVGGGDALDGQGVVVDLARAVAGATQVDADLALGVVGDGDVAGGNRGGEGEAAALGRGDGQALATSDVQVVGDAGEDAAAALELEGLPVDLDGGAAGEGQDEELGRAGLDDLGGTGLENEDAQSREGPTGTLGLNIDGEIAMAGGAGGNVNIGKSHRSLLKVGHRCRWMKRGTRLGQVGWVTGGPPFRRRCAAARGWASLSSIRCANTRRLPRPRRNGSCARGPILRRGRG